MALTTTRYSVYRNTVLVAQGQLYGSTQISYTPPDASPANYTVIFNVDGASPSAPGSLGRRSMSFIGYRR